jgi:hypothetical protein
VRRANDSSSFSLDDDGPRILRASTPARLSWLLPFEVMARHPSKLVSPVDCVLSRKLVHQSGSTGETDFFEVARRAQTTQVNGARTGRVTYIVPRICVMIEPVLTWLARFCEKFRCFNQPICTRQARLSTTSNAILVPSRRLKTTWWCIIGDV